MSDRLREYARLIARKGVNVQKGQDVIITASVEDKDFVNRLHYHQYSVGYGPKAFGNHDREFRPLTHAGFLRNEYVYHLSEYANINYSAWQGFAYGILAVCKKSVEALLKGRFGLSKDYLQMIFRLIAQSREVFTQRKNNRLSYPNYIHS